MNADTQSIKIAIIGSFKKHYRSVLKALTAFQKIGVVVTSPKGTSIIKEGEPFVRFVSDQKDAANPLIQTIALHRILRADLVYVVAPQGYVGNTTCYEIGRIIQCKRPLYFSAKPEDLPIEVPSGHIMDIDKIVDLIASGFNSFKPLYLNSVDTSIFERDLLLNIFREDNELDFKL
jgi:hypothetical protein